MNLIKGNFITQFLVCYPGWFPAPAGNPYVRVLMGGIAPLGATLGGLTGGSTQDALVGATVAGNAAANNFLKHQQFNEFKSRYAQCTTKECRDNVLTDMKTLSDAQDVLLTKCTTVAACKELTRDIVYPTKQNGFLGFFITKTTDTYNFCAAGDGACMDTLKYISAHTNGAALTSIAPEFFAAVNWKTATIESGTAELEARFDLSPQTARMLASILSEMGQGVALLGTKVGKDGAGTQKNAVNIVIDGKIASQISERGWTQQEIQKVVNQGAVGTTTDNRSPSKTSDGLGRSDPASVYGSKSGYVVVNDRTGEVVQISGKNDPDWIPDSRIKWK